MTGCLRVLVVALAASVCGAPAAWGQSLGAVAKKEEQRRKTAKPAAKTLTNKDLGPGGTAPEAPPAATPDPAASPDATKTQPQPPEAPPDPRQTEEYWRDRIDGTREEIRQNEMFLEALQSRINALSTDFVNRDDPYQRATISSDRQKALAEMARVKDTLAKLKQQILDIEEEARQAGVPPGWIR